jgi:hypothetical protein
MTPMVIMSVVAIPANPMIANTRAAPPARASGGFSGGRSP